MDWLRRLMAGRYGADQLTWALLGASILLTFLARLTHFGVLSMLGLVALVLCYLRIFSRNIQARRQENQKFLQLWWPLRRHLEEVATVVRESRTHRHFRCPFCKKKVRVPRGRGKICITCPACHQEFLRKT